MTFRRLAAVVMAVLCALVLTGYGYLHHPKFGAIAPAGQFAGAARYANGQFHNLEPAPPPPPADEDKKGWLDFLLASGDGKIPPAPVPVEKTDLLALDRAEDLVIWLGHSSFYIQLAGKRILIDPVLSRNASPIPMTNLAFAGSTPYSAADIPDIDYLLISHDHWDHLDYPTVMALRDRIGRVVAGLGVGEHFRAWGFAAERIHEADWNSALQLDEALTIHILPARHYSGRGLKRNQSLWVSYALLSREQKLFFSGDSGYGKHFKAIGETFGGFDLALLDSGQYDQAWRHIHMTPEDAARAADDIEARAVMPAHVGKFSIAFHTWDDPFKRLAAASRGRSWQLVTPRIGQVTPLAPAQSPAQWPAQAWWAALPLDDSRG